MRLQGCGVGCQWCDTKYSWDFAAGDLLAIERIWDRARALGEASMLVVTGGEPLQQAGIERLLAQAVERWERVEMESSGIGPPPLSHPRLYFNLSPKLPSATPRWEETWQHIPAWLAEPRVTFKIVIGDPPDLDDARRLIGEHAIPPGRVMLMPEGTNETKLRARAVELAEACKRNGYRLSPRLHIWMWGARRGV